MVAANSPFYQFIPAEFMFLIWIMPILLWFILYKITARKGSGDERSKIKGHLYGAISALLYVFFDLFLKSNSLFDRCSDTCGLENFVLALIYGVIVVVLVIKLATIEQKEEVSLQVESKSIVRRDTLASIKLRRIHILLLFGISLIALINLIRIEGLDFGALLIFLLFATLPLVFAWFLTRNHPVVAFAFSLIAGIGSLELVGFFVPQIFTVGLLISLAWRSFGAGTLSSA